MAPKGPPLLSEGAADGMAVTPKEPMSKEPRRKPSGFFMFWDFCWSVFDGDFELHLQGRRARKADLAGTGRCGLRDVFLGPGFWKQRCTVEVDT